MARTPPPAPPPLPATRVSCPSVPAPVENVSTDCDCRAGATPGCTWANSKSGAWPRGVATNRLVRAVRFRP
ncbi:hypothetical protein D7W82_03125 [Corallococcus sp. CA049B]|nr:hypothetical protein D7W82_03125 [Corallococcus sp. CA049B]